MKITHKKGKFLLSVEVFMITMEELLMADKLDIIAFKKGLQVAKIGVLTNDIISLTGLKRDVGDILLWQDRFSYLEKHKEDFSTEEEFYYHIEQIPDIIENPNYVGLHLY